jgi:methionine-rich copper-binding protein CopC
LVFSRPVSKLAWVPAILVAVLLLAAIQIVALKSPVFLSSRVAVGHASVVGYRLATPLSAQGAPVKVTLYSTRPLPKGFSLFLVPLTPTRGAPFQKSSAYGARPRQWTKTVVEVHPSVPPGLYSLRLGRGPSFGYVDIR